MNLNQVTLPAHDISASVAFYRRMGFEQIVDSSHYARFRSPEGEATFSIHQVPPHALGSATLVYFECAALDAQVERLRTRGIEFSQLPRDEPWLWREARLFDPAGNELCLYHAGSNRLDPPWRIPSDGANRRPASADLSPFESSPVLLTPRLRLRRLCERDLPDMLAIHRRPEVNRYIPYADWRGMDDARQWFDKVRQRHSAGSSLHLAITFPDESERVIGAALLFGFDKENGLAEIGYAMGSPHHGHGLMREAVDAMVDYAFEVLDVRRLEAVVDVRNTPSHRLLLALGFIHEGMRPQQYVTKGEITDMNVYGLLRTHWRTT